MRLLTSRVDTIVYTRVDVDGQTHILCHAEEGGKEKGMLIMVKDGQKVGILHCAKVKQVGQIVYSHHVFQC